jgi:hypothetical protein
MTTRWAITIAANLALFAALCVWRPRRIAWLWVSQSTVLVCTCINVWGWYHWSDNHYNTVWTRLDILQAALEAVVLVGLVVGIAKKQGSYADAFAAYFIAHHLVIWYSEYAGWHHTALFDGAYFLWMRQWINLLVIAALTVTVYYRSRRSPRPGGLHEIRSEV